MIFQIKRAIVVLFIIVLLPVFTIVAILIFLFDGWPVIFKQVRIGYKKEKIIVFKFKTMHNNNITKFWKILRKLQIDELPQIFNIYLGNMNFIWPRILTHNDIERISRNIDWYNRRWDIKPWITWLWQFAYKCDSKITITYDKYYYNNKWIKLDIYITLMTCISFFIWRQSTKKIFYFFNKIIIWI